MTVYQFGGLVLDGFNILVFAYFLLLNSVYLLTIIVAFKALPRDTPPRASLDRQDLLPSVLAPALTLTASAVNSRQIS